MRGQIIIENVSGIRWLYVEACTVYFRACLSGQDDMIIVAFPTDDYRKITATEIIPATEWLVKNFTFAEEVEVPDEIANFAIASVRARDTEANNLGHLFAEAVDSGFAKAFSEFAKAVASEANAAREDDYAREVDKLINGGGGQQ